MSEVLESLLGSRARTRMLRFFLLNPSQEYTLAEVTKKNMLKTSEARREANNLLKIKFILTKKKKGKKYYFVNPNFSFYPELERLVVKSNIFPQCKSLGKVKSIGNAKLVMVSGIFLNYPKSKADLLLVIDNVSRAKLKNLMNVLEAEIGKEIRYVLINSEELKYRLDMLDRFLLDFFESPHDEVINRMPKLRRLIDSLKKK